MSTEEPWVMPEWMVPFEEQGLLFGHGGNGTTDLINRLRTIDNLAFTNAIVFTMAMQMEAQVGLLHRLRNAGLLKELESAHNDQADQPTAAEGVDGRPVD
jgi:hypothetical protein